MRVQLKFKYFYAVTDNFGAASKISLLAKAAYCSKF
jgi:hypothetical protein